MARRERLTIFDFDGTLFELATDYDALRRSLLELAPGVRASGLLELLAQLESHNLVGEQARAIADEAELEGLHRGSAKWAAIHLFEERATSSGTTAIVTHNARPTIRAFLGGRRLPEPDELFDRRRLGAPKDLSKHLDEWIDGGCFDERVVIGDGDVDHRLAVKLNATFLRPEDI